MSFTDLEKQNFIGGFRNLLDKMSNAPGLSNEKFDYCLGLYEIMIYNYDLAVAVDNGRSFLSTSIQRAQDFSAAIRRLIEQGRTDRILTDCLRVLEEFLALTRTRTRFQPVDLQGRFNIVANVNDIDE
jgi:hypothetical protein